MSLDSDNWLEELRESLCQHKSTSRHELRQMCHDKIIPRTIRAQLWQKILVSNEQPKIVLDEFFDLPEQSSIRHDSLLFVQSLEDVEESDKLSLSSDVESIITTISKKFGIAYASDNGWIELMKPILSLGMESKVDMYCLLTEIMRNYIPYKKSSRIQAYHLLRLLILYHDPELCSFLDSKKIHPEFYAGPWFRTLFGSATISLDVTETLWDAYFLKGDPFLMFFISLVLLINSRESILEMKTSEKEEIIQTISTIPTGLQVDDISDLITLIDTHYSPQTPSLNYLRCLLFDFDDQSSTLPSILDLSHSLCLPVRVEDMIPSSESLVKYFVIDCRSPEQYNSGHLSTAFHLDCSLMLQDKVAFDIAVEALLVVQRQAIDAHSVCGGTHVCFVGSGRNDEDSYVYMVVASFLQKNHKFVSLCFGGFRSLHDLIRRQRLDQLLADHDPVKCSVCSPKRRESNLSTSSSLSTISGRFFSSSPDGQCTLSIFDKLSTAVKSKTTEVKGKIAELVANKNQDKYRGLSLFNDSEDFNYEDIVDEVEVEVNVESWAKEQSAIATFTCKEIKEDHSTHDSYLVLTQSNIYILRESLHRKGQGKVVAKRPLEMIVQITSKRKVPEIITFKYGETNESSEAGPNIIATDCLIFLKPYDVTRLVKQQVIKVLDGEVTEGK